MTYKWILPFEISVLINISGFKSSRIDLKPSIHISELTEFRNEMIIWEWEWKFSECVRPENWKLNCWSVNMNECVMSVRKKLQLWQVWHEWSVCRDNYSHDNTNLSSSFPISCQTLPKDCINSDIIAVSSNPQLPIQTRTPVALEAIIFICKCMEIYVW